MIQSTNQTTPNLIQVFLLPQPPPKDSWWNILKILNFNYNFESIWFNLFFYYNIYIILLYNSLFFLFNQTLIVTELKKKNSKIILHVYILFSLNNFLFRTKTSMEPICLVNHFYTSIMLTLLETYLSRTLTTLLTETLEPWITWLMVEIWIRCGISSCQDFLVMHGKMWGKCHSLLFSPFHIVSQLTVLTHIYNLVRLVSAVLAKQ